MKNTATYALALAIIALAAVVAIQPANADRIGTYHLVAHSNQTSNVGIFRINETTGMVSFCFIEGTTNSAVVHCTPEVQ